MNTLTFRTGFAGTIALVIGMFCATPSVAQNSPLQAKVEQAKQLMMANKQQLSRYTWQVQETVSVNGDVKTQDVYQVQIGPDGKQVRTLVAQPVAPQAGRPHGIRHRIEDRYKEYAQQVGALAKSYSQLDPGKLQQLYAQGSVALKSGGAPGYSAIVISNYLKQGDSIVVTFSDNPKALVAVGVNSYLSGPSDSVTMQVRFASLPDGTHYSSPVTVIGQSKGLKIVDQSSNFAPRTQ